MPPSLRSGQAPQSRRVEHVTHGIATRPMAARDDFVVIARASSRLELPRRSMQADGRIRFWGWVPELGRWLRVITLEDGVTVHNAFPDRDFDPGRRP